MSPEQEAKLDRVLEISVRNDEKIIALTQTQSSHGEKIEDLQASKNKQLGVLASLALVFSTLGAWLMAIIFGK